MAIKIPWMLVCACGVPLFMIWTKAKRMDAREIHEIQMRVKYHSEYWQRGNAFAAKLQTQVATQLAATADPLVGRDVSGITDKEWAVAMKDSGQQQRQQGEKRHRKWLLF